MSDRSISSRSAVAARAQEAQEAILRRGATMSVSLQRRQFGCSPLVLSDRGDSS
jgi:hypothetical protein